VVQQQGRFDASITLENRSDNVAKVREARSSGDSAPKIDIKELGLQN
jgi:hypothetical protein